MRLKLIIIVLLLSSNLIQFVSSEDLDSEMVDVAYELKISHVKVRDVYRVPWAEGPILHL